MLRFMDSFDHYANASVLAKWSAISHADANNALGTGRFGSGQVMVYGDRTLDVVIDGQSEWIVGAAMRWSSFASTGQPVICWLDGSTAQVELRINSNSRLYVARNGTQLGSEGPTTLTLNTWYYIEWRVLIHDSTGETTVRISGIDEIVETGLDTRNAGATADTFRLGGRGSFSGGLTFDDLYICDGTGSAPTDTFLGDTRIEAIFPNGNGNSSQFDGSDGNTTDNYLLVDESAPNSDTDYVQSPDVGDKDTYAYGNLASTTGTVFGVQPLAYVKKANAGTRTMVSVARLSGTEVDGPVKTVLDTYKYVYDVREAKPGGGVWTISDVNGAEFGYKVNS